MIATDSWVMQHWRILSWISVGGLALLAIIWVLFGIYLVWKK